MWGVVAVHQSAPRERVGHDPEVSDDTLPVPGSQRVIAKGAFGFLICAIAMAAEPISPASVIV